MSKREVAKQAAQKRSASKGSKAQGTVGGAPKAGGATGAQGLSFLTEDAPGLKVHPQTVLIVCLVYIGVVVLLHIWSKIRGGAAMADTQQTM